ncbi:MAG: YCF48-related protein [Verrucomicrobiota bacterium]|nr:YCF48-related protein [Verrucomicrobiota bacterium]
MSKSTKTCAVLAFTILASCSALAQWEPVVSGTANLLRGVALLDSGVGYAVGDGGTILKSTDAGATWSALASGTGSTLYDVHFFDDSTGVVVGDGGLILRTTDGGTSWGAVTSGVRDALRAVSFSGANGICSGGSLDILYSSDSGATWTVAQKNLFASGFFGAHMLSPTVGFVTGQNAIFQGIFGSTVDGGAHWSFHTFYFNNSEGSADDVFFFDGATGITSGVVFDGTGAIARTTNTGSTWNSSLFPQGLQGIDFPKPEAGFTVGFFGTIFKSTDLGLNWSAQESGTTFDLLDVRFASDGLTGLAVGANGTILRTSNGGSGDEFALVAAASRKGHFEIDLPLTGTPGVECRDGGARGNYNVALTFNHDLSSVDGAATSCGTVGGFEIDPEDESQLLVRLTGVDCNAEDVTLTLTGVQDDAAGVLPSVEVTMTLLLGDVSGDGILNSTDVRQTKRALKERTDETNFRADVNADGVIDAVDFAIVKGQVAAGP